jgi:hypothetical protein
MAWFELHGLRGKVPGRCHSGRGHEASGFWVRQPAEAVGGSRGRLCWRGMARQGEAELGLSIIVTLTAGGHETRGRRDAVISCLCCRKRYAPRRGEGGERQAAVAMRGGGNAALVLALAVVVLGGPWWCLVVLVWSCVCMKRAGRAHCRHGHSQRRDGSRQDGQMAATPVARRRWRALSGGRWAEGGQRAALCEGCRAPTAAGVPLSVPQITMGSAPATPWAARRRRRRPLACLGRQRQ